MDANLKLENLNGIQALSQHVKIGLDKVVHGHLTLFVLFLHLRETL